MESVHILGMDLMLHTFHDWYMDFQLSKPHTEWQNEKKIGLYVKILWLGSKEQEYMEFPPEEKRDPDSS